MDGTNQSDVLTGTAGADVINAGNGTDTVSGGAGNDILHGDNGNDTLDGGLGVDLVYGDRGDDTLIYFVEADALGNDVYDGGQGSDTLVINLNNMALPDSYADSAALKQALTDYFNSHVGQTMDFSSFNIHLTATNLEHLVLQGDAVVPPPDVLGRAWINVDGDAAHTFGAGDIEIARIEDTNGDHVVSKGDQIILNAYPTSIEGDISLNVASYGVPKIQTIDQYLSSPFSSKTIEVNTDEGYHFRWTHTDIDDQLLILTSSDLSPVQLINDPYLGRNLLDTALTDLTPVSTFEDTGGASALNEHFIDVSININMA